MDAPRLIASLLGFLPLFGSAYARFLSLCLALTASVFVGALASGDGGRRDLFVAAEAVAAVLLTLVIGLALRIERTVLGALRILWLVVTVTSSCSYAFFQEVGDVEFLPNDVTIAALAVSLGCLLLSVCCARLFVRNHQAENAASRPAKLGVEAALVCGALCLRFEEDFTSVVQMRLGWACWHLASNLAAGGAIVLLRRARRDADDIFGAPE